MWWSEESLCGIEPPQGSISMAVRMIGAAPAALKWLLLCIKCQAEFKGCIDDHRQSVDKSQWVKMRQVDLQCFNSFKK